jgi:hypothetical protein
MKIFTVAPYYYPTVGGAEQHLKVRTQSALFKTSCNERDDDRQGGG